MTMTRSPARRPEPATPLRSTAGFIPEIQGLRTVALLLVAIYHIWFDRVSGGVDVFLLISAYLMTRSLTGRAERGNRTNAPRFLLRKFARLLPSASAAIVLALAAVLLLMPASMWFGNAMDAIASITYTENLRLQATGTDYFAVDNALASPFQHFWSLSIQGQVFVAWAIIHVVVEQLSRLVRVPVRPFLLVVFLGISAASFIWSLEFTAIDQTSAYFDTFARLWEFGAGSLLALVQPWLRLPRALRAAAGWIGLAGIISCGWLLPVESSFPGWAALWPVVSAALVIGSAGAPTGFGADRLLALPVLGRIGGYTYALYLTHWPVLVVTLFVTGVDRPGWALGGIILAISAALSVLIVHAVEQPADRYLNGIRRRRRNAPAGAPASGRPSAPAWRERFLRPGVIIAVTVIGALVAAQALQFASVRERERAEASLENADYSQLGANSPFDGLVGDGYMPGSAAIKLNWTRPGAPCAPDDPYATGACFVAPALVDGPDRRMILNIGNSHTNQLAGTLLETVSRQDAWTLRTQLAADCRWEWAHDDAPDGPCRMLWDAAQRFIEEAQPDMVVLIATYASPEGERGIEGLTDWIVAAKELSPGTVFLAVRDNPRLHGDLAECLIDGRAEPAECAGVRIPGDPGETRAELEAVGSVWIDFDDAICSGETCAAVRGGVVTYMDDNHLTDAYSRTLSQTLADQLRAAGVDWWPEDAYAGEYIDRSDRDVDIIDLLNE